MKYLKPPHSHSHPNIIASTYIYLIVLESEIEVVDDGLLREGVQAHQVGATRHLE